MLNSFNYTVNDIKKDIVRRDTWGDYLVIDNFLKASVFEELCKDFNYWKTEDDGIWSGQENPRVWRFTEPKGMNLIIALPLAFNSRVSIFFVLSHTLI